MLVDLNSENLLRFFIFGIDIHINPWYNILVNDITLTNGEGEKHLPFLCSKRLPILRIIYSSNS